MGGIFGKSKRCCVFPRVVYKAKGKRTPGMFCDASTWTGENHFYSARIGRTPKGPEPSPAKLVLETRDSEAEEEAAGPATPPRAQHTKVSLSVAAEGVEASQEPEAKPPTEVLQHQELTEQAEQAQPESSGPGDAPCPPSEEPHLARVTVEVDVHVPAEEQGGPGEAQPAPAECELPPGAGQEAGGAPEEAGVGRAPWEVPVQEAGGSPAAEQDSGLPLEAAETTEGTTNGHGAAEDAETPPDLQLGQGTEVPIAEGVKAGAPEAEQAGEVAELCEDGHTSESPAGTQDALQDREEIEVSSGEKAGEH